MRMPGMGLLDTLGLDAGQTHTSRRNNELGARRTFTETNRRPEERPAHGSAQFTSALRLVPDPYSRTGTRRLPVPPVPPVPYLPYRVGDMQ